MARRNWGERWSVLAPWLFVLMWSSGFVGAKYGMPYAPPLTFLVLRMLGVILVMGLLVWLARLRWPGWPAVLHAAVAGLMLQACYLGGVFAAISHGLSAGMVAVIAGLQPVLTAAVAPLWLGERVSGRQWLGFVLGFVGVVLVVGSRLAPGSESAGGVGFALLALFGISAGTLYQKRFVTVIDPRLSALIQYGATLCVLLPLAVVSEDMRVRWTGDFIFALAFLVLVLSAGAVLLLLGLIRHGVASRVASLFFLVPPTTALIAWAVFGESLGRLALLGMAVAAVGVALVNRGAGAARGEAGLIQNKVGGRASAP